MAFMVSCTESRRHTKTEPLNIDSLAKISIKSDTVIFINKQISNMDEDKKLYSNINYPQIVYYHIPESQQIINSIIKSIVDDTKSAFFMEVPGKDFLDSIGIVLGDDLRNEFNIEYEVLNNSSTITSVIFNVMQFHADAAHSLDYHKSVNFDLHRSKMITEDDFFADSTLIKRISYLSRIELLKRGTYDTSWVNNGTLPLIENFRNFNLGKNALIITFDPYQVGPYSDGSHRISLNYKLFDTLLPNIIIDKNFK